MVCENRFFTHLFFPCLFFKTGKRIKREKRIFGSARAAWRVVNIVLSSVLLLSAPPSFGHAQSQRLVSLNLCTDQLLLLLAKRADIVGVSALAADCAESPLCEKARGLPSVRPDGEALINLHPTLVLDDAWGHASFDRLAQHGAFKLARLPEERALQGQGEDEMERIADKLALVGTWIGRPEEGARQAQAFRAALSALRPRAADHAPTAVVLGANDPLLKALLVRAGFKTRPDTNGEARVEALLRDPPDLLVRSTLEEGASLTERLPPVLARRFTGKRRLDLPARFLLCPAPAALEALRRLIQAHDRLSDEKPLPPSRVSADL